MANNYTQSSGFLRIPADKLDQARVIVASVLAKWREDEDFCPGIDVGFYEDGVLIYGEDNFDPDYAIELVQALLDGLEIDEPFLMSWAYTCSKMRVDEFGGGAMALRRGREPFVVDAMSAAHAHVAQDKLADSYPRTRT